MNKNGFTLIELLATILIIAFIMGIVFPSIKRISEENKEKIYYTYEEMMIEYAQANIHNSIDFIELADLEGLENIKKECDGYVIINHNLSPVEYKSYIKCENGYQTPGYNKP